MHTVRLTGRKSALSLLQIELVRQKIRAAMPDISIEVITVDTLGDQLRDIPLQTAEGTDFFTTEVFAMLADGRADIAVHSLKDMSAAHFFGANKFAVTEREDNRDVAIFNVDVSDKIRRGESIIVGTCSPRREDMAIDFLSSHLPSTEGKVAIEVKPIRGNVETRLQKLDQGLYDGTILATAGLNRLLRSDLSSPLVRSLLADKRMMILPLLECVPAPCQGAIVAEAKPSNALAVQVLEAINNPALMQDCIREKQLAQSFGVGCDQRFGVSVMRLGKSRFTYAAGKDGRGRPISYWEGLPDPIRHRRSLFSSTDHMRSFYTQEYDAVTPTIETEAVFIANYKAVNEAAAKAISGKRVWVSGSKTWKQLAGMGIWVEGSADAFGLASIQALLETPLVALDPNEITILTNQESVKRWNGQGRRAVSTYRSIPALNALLGNSLQNYGFAFWTSFGQYQQFQQQLPDDMMHACPGGETAVRFKEAGIDPVVFPNIQSFQTWRKSITI